ncbi:MAG TPA: transcription-repair coupling factor, partial [Verrucomicrobiota bacterium]|nr:transcription-repair coupling factor [Verrucomicrobiota bacterium]
PRRLSSKYIAGSSIPPLDITELEEGDYVVHINYGIGRFLGLERIKVSEQVKNDKEGQECLVIEYAPSRKGQSPPRLYVPVTEAHLVTKYIGTGRGRPILSKLSGKKWQKDKEKAKNAIRDLAAELLSLQAERLSSTGFAFTSDTTWQHDFENSFEFEETPDQIQAIIDTKADMESPKPMDRLICGDVGYGKTEVALRAAFKAVMSGKQVAVLVPTTVLAQQHYNTFRTRMAPYPINIGLLSRFKTKGKQKNVIEGMSSGSVDIVIGTHRLLQDDVVFHDLGLVIIDEEQRFGVLHKEKLKLIKRKVDVLTLTATPIPRTLYMALTGARDMSIIQTPPHDRLPIETVVSKYDENLIRSAILKELNRGGQVYFLHNQIYDIDNVAERLKSIVPEARIVVAHGRMRPHILEDAMSKFINREADVLLSTTIVENGLDIPNANTIIINRADKFGLSDLYQLRGRIGRYKNQAYAFLLLPKHIELLGDARKRISAIKQYSSLGSGFKIAMRDLEIRGAGNILGVEQSGHIAAIGFHLYCQLLENEIKSVKGQKIESLPTVNIHLDFIALSPADEVQQPRSIKKTRTKKGRPIFVPRDVAYYCDDEEIEEDEDTAIIKAPAYIPSNYIN